jgi:acetolactate synthase-1/2/3 large subunit
VESLSKAYGLPYERIDSHDTMAGSIRTVLQAAGPVVCEVMLLQDQKFSPRVSSEKKPDGTMVSKPLEDMYPFLPREEYNKNIITD